jgi:hypothetical protein
MHTPLDSLVVAKLNRKGEPVIWIDHGAPEAKSAAKQG